MMPRQMTSGIFIAPFGVGCSTFYGEMHAVGIVKQQPVLG
jgi:hypothetical protein